MRPTLPQLHLTLPASRPSADWSQATQLQRKLPNSSKILRNKQQALIAASLQMGVGLSNTLQHPVDSFLQQLRQFTQPTSASAVAAHSEPSKGSPATTQWHGVTLQTPPKVEQGTRHGSVSAACNALKVGGIDQLQVHFLQAHGLTARRYLQDNRFQAVMCMPDVQV